MWKMSGHVQFDCVSAAAHT